MFETFNVPAMYMECSSSLALYSLGFRNAIVVDSGLQTTRIAPIYQGHCLKSCCKRLDIGGYNVTDYLQKISAERGYAFTTTKEKEYIEDVKNKFGYVAIDFDEEMNSKSMEETKEKMYELPDGQVLSFANERFRCAEVVFKPEFVGTESKGLSGMLYESIMGIEDEELQKLMCDNIILCGGNTLFDGFKERLQNDLGRYYDVDIKIDAQRHRQYIQWVGGSIFSNMSTFKDYCIDKDEYDEYGPDTVTWRCF